MMYRPDHFLHIHEELDSWHYRFAKSSKTRVIPQPGRFQRRVMLAGFIQVSWNPPQNFPLGLCGVWKSHSVSPILLRVYQISDILGGLTGAPAAHHARRRLPRRVSGASNLLTPAWFELFITFQGQSIYKNNRYTLQLNAKTPFTLSIHTFFAATSQMIELLVFSSKILFE